MRLVEYEAKNILQRYNIPLPKSYIADNEPEFLPVVLKSQVPVGGRGKAGGVVRVDTNSEYKEAVTKIKKLPIKGFLPAKLLAETPLDLKNEFYLSLLVNKNKAKIELMAHVRGGVEVEENRAADFLRYTLNEKNSASAGELLAEHFDLPDKTFVLQDLIKNLYECFTQNDALLLEINPLVLDSDGNFTAADCKMELDSAAKYRHDDWRFEAGQTNANFVTLDEDGNVATIANGAGLAMATVDAVANAQLKPANFLDIGGGANEASVLAAFERIMQYSNVKVIVINIFAGITRCDEVARAIISAKSHFADLPPLCIRLAGTNFEQAAELLKNESIPTLATLEECIKSAKEHTK